MFATKQLDLKTQSSFVLPQNNQGSTRRYSCAECKRLKLRCDRKVPCESCVRRGCTEICPNGSFTSGKWNRYCIASTQELHEKISELCSRMRELEGALREYQAQLQSDKNTLLTKELHHEDDELSKLGGKTRLISQKEQSKSPSSHLVTRSPNTRNLVVPRPLLDASAGVHPSVVDYPPSYNTPAAAQQSHSQASSMQQDLPSSSSYHFENDDTSAMQMQQQTELPSPVPPLQTPTSATPTSSPHQLVLPSPHGQTQSHQQVPSSQQPYNYFPQYFPVFDYGTSGNSSGYAPLQLTGNSAGFEQGPLSMAYDNVPTQNGGAGGGVSSMNGISGIDARGYTSANSGNEGRRDILPETSMNTAWIDFVTQMSAGMNG